MHPYPYSKGFSIRNPVILGITDNPTIIDTELANEVAANINSPVPGPSGTWESKAIFIDLSPTKDPTPLEVNWGVNFEYSVGHPYILLPTTSPNFGEYLYYAQFNYSNRFPLYTTDTVSYVVFKTIPLTYNNKSYIAYKSMGINRALEVIIAPNIQMYHSNKV